MLTEIFGEYPQVKVMDLLLSHNKLEYTKTDIAECAGISKPTLYKFWDTIERFKLVIPTRKIGNTTLYMINKDSPIIKALDAFQLGLVDMVVDEEKDQIEEGQLQEILA